MKYIKGDLIQLAKDGEFDVIIHGCNCQSVMGAGIAFQIKKEFPQAYQAYMRDDQKLGGFSAAYIPKYEDMKKSICVINAYTQFYPGPDASYDAIRECFTLIERSVSVYSKIGIPKIGCGIGGLDWTIVESIIDDIMYKHDVTCVIYE